MKEDKKIFTDPFGKFQMLTPIGYQYKNPSFERNGTQPHAFGGYDTEMGAFQISCRPINPHIAEMIKSTGLTVYSDTSSKPLAYRETVTDLNDMVAYTWTAAVRDHFILATFIYGKEISSVAEKEVANVKACLESLKFIKPEFRSRVLAYRRYDMFMTAMAAAIDLRNKALENGSFIEIIILTANQIDSMLRLSLMLKSQLDNHTDEIDTSLLFQDEQDKIVMERKIYSMALEAGLISNTIYEKLEELYKARNKVVHRYIITDLRTEQIIKIVFAYYKVEADIDRIVNALELQQYQSKVGTNANVEPGRLEGQDLEKLRAAVKDKHGYVKWDKIDDIDSKQVNL